MKKFLRFSLLTLVMGILLAVLVLPVTAMAMGAADVAPTDVTAAVQVLKDWLPVLSIVLLGLGQALKGIPGFRPWLLPIIMAAIGLAFGIVIGVLLGGPPLQSFGAALEGLIVGLSATGLYELANKVSPANKDSSS